MKKIDKTVLITVILGIIGVSVFLDIVRYQCSGWNPVIIGGGLLETDDKVSAAFDIIVGLILNIPIIFLLMRLFGKERKIKLFAPLINLGVIFIIFVFMIVHVALKNVWDAQSFAVTLFQLGVLFVINDLCDFKHLIKKVKVEEPVEKAEPEKEETTIAEENKPEEIAEETTKEIVEEEKPAEITE